MFRFAVAVLAIVGLVALVTGGITAAGVGLGLLLVPLLFLAKIVFFVLLFGAFARMCWYKGGRGYERPSMPDWWARRPPHRGRREEPASREKDFEQWHRMAHAREEVERWTEGMPGTDENA